MNQDDDFTPRLGRIGDRGANVVRVSRQIRRAAARHRRPRRKRPFTGKRFAAGTAAARMAQMRPRRIPAIKLRRVVVKVHIARAKAGKSGAFGAHLKYIERDGVGRQSERGQLYDRSNDAADGDAFRERSADDKRQFRLVISPEDGSIFNDLKENTRSLMARVESDLDRSLDWIAVDHFNTGYPHTHVVIRGKALDGRDLVIARDYLMEGLRLRASELATEHLGPRRDLDILRSRSAEVGKDRFTSIDRELAARAIDGPVRLPIQTTSRARFDDALVLRRLRHLETLGLAIRDGVGRWRFQPGWEESLRSLGRRDDIVRTMAAAFGERSRPRAFEIFAQSVGKTIVGRIAGHGLVDETRDDRFALIDATDGKTWYVELGVDEILPPKGVVIEVSPSRREPRQSDQTISRIARANDGAYSDDLHRNEDPYSTSEYREAHKRRLEALRRAGIVERLKDGSWRIPRDLIEQGSDFDQKRNGAASLRTLSWRRLEELITAQAVTWLDDIEEGTLAQTGFGRVARDARAARAQWLQAEGLMTVGQTRLSAETRQRLEGDEVLKIASSEARRSGRRFQALAAGRPFDGAFERTIDGAARRFAVIGNDAAFTLAPWRPELERMLSQRLLLKVSGGRSIWQIDKGLER